MSAGRLILLAGLATVTGLPIVGVSTRRAEDTEGYWRNGWRELASDADDGFLVWESRRSGSWRILRRSLAGGDVAQISPNEVGRDHFAPHLSPDGTRLVFASLPAGTNFYEPLPDGVFAQLRIMNTDGSADRELVAKARGYFEDRVAVWIDDDHLFYIDEHGATQRLTLSTMATRQQSAAANRLAQQA